LKNINYTRPVKLTCFIPPDFQMLYSYDNYRKAHGITLASLSHNLLVEYCQQRTGYCQNAIAAKQAHIIAGA